MADLQGKYQILAAEYSKLKAQIPVLKKAYLDEQIETEKLKELIKERDQSVRKYEQEVDSLSFRNQQLTKRVLFLQDELEHMESSKKKNKHKDNDVELANVSSRANSILSEELQSKIEENALLHKKVHEATSQYEDSINGLEHRLKLSETERSQHEEVLNATRQKSKAQIDKLQEEKAMLEVKLQTYDTELKDFRVRAELAEEKLETLQRNLQSKLDSANKIIADKLPFIDTKNRDLNRLNIPTHDRKHQMRARELVNQSSHLVGELVQGLSNFYTYSEQRSKIYPADGVSEPHSAINTTYCKYLHENMAYLRPVQQSLHLFSESLKEDSLTTLETATDLQLFSKNFQNLVAYMNRLLPYQLSSVEEECAVSSCTSTLAAKNMELFKSLKRLTTVFNKLETYVTVLGAQSKAGMTPHPQSSHIKFFTQLSRVLSDLQDAVKDVSKHYNSKVSLEHQLPTATQKLKTTDECVVASLVSLVTNTGKISAFLSGNLDFLSQSAGYRPRGGSSSAALDTAPRSHPAVSTFKVRSAKYLASLARPCPESVAHRVAVHNRKTLLSSTESKHGLTHQISVFQQRVNKLEQEKEHWMLELQLLKIKYENELTKTKQHKQEIDRLHKAEGREDSIEDNLDTALSVTAAATATAAASAHVHTTMLGKLTHQPESSDIDSREELIKKHYTSRIGDLSLQIQALDSKCVNFHAEVRALHKQLQLAQKSKCGALAELNTSSQSLAQLKDELQTTSRSYEGQLSMMSDHLAGMNEKLTQQKDEIDDLKMQLQSASSKIICSLSHERDELKERLLSRLNLAVSSKACTKPHLLQTDMNYKIVYELLSTTIDDIVSGAERTRSILSKADLRRNLNSKPVKSSLKEHTSGLPDIKSVRFRHPIASYKDPPTEDELDKKPLSDYLQSQFKTKIYIQMYTMLGKMADTIDHVLDSEVKTPCH